MHLLVRQEGNQYSFENTWIAEEDNQVVGSITVYDGAKLQQLRQPVLSLLVEKYQRVVSPEKETEPGEFYIDTIAVHPNHQGKGLGTQLLNFAISQIVHQDGNVLGLLVDVNNSKAKNLYLRLGFQPVGTKQLMGHPYEHLQMRRRAKR
jgi:ribosomal protein S18 acetylase RimI-like enzyme